MMRGPLYQVHSRRRHAGGRWGHLEEERADVVHEDLRLLERGEVSWLQHSPISGSRAKRTAQPRDESMSDSRGMPLTALLLLRPVDQVVRRFYPRSWWAEDLARVDRRAGRHLYERPAGNVANVVAEGGTQAFIVLGHLPLGPGR